MFGKMEPGDRARAQRLATTVLQRMDQADQILSPYLRKAPPAFVMNVLRLAVIEVAVFETPPHGAVSAAVELVRRDRKHRHLSALSNAVLRRVVSDLAERWPELAPQMLPAWIRDPALLAWGPAVVHAMELAHMRPASTDLTLRSNTTEGLIPELGGSELPTGSVRLTAPGQISKLPGYEQGAWWVQDAAAAIPARVLDVKPGERVLDLCAAPGGKTMQLADSGADVIAVDASASRMKLLSENLKRVGLSAKEVVEDALDWEPSEPFNAILLDAPCSATGTIRRHPDLPRIKDGSEVKGLVKLQEQLFDRAIDWLRPGGRLVYATCSILPVEGEDQVKSALSRHPKLRLDFDAMQRTELDPAWIGEFGIRLRPDHWPEHGGLDGFFIAAFARD